MNTIVFVILVATNNGFWLPTIEFSSKAKCEAALAELQRATGGPPKWNHPSVSGKCVRIEK